MLVHSCKLKDDTNDCFEIIEKCDTGEGDEDECGPIDSMGEYDPCMKGSMRNQCKSTCALLNHGVHTADNEDGRCLFNREIALKMDYLKREREAESLRGPMYVEMVGACHSLAKALSSKWENHTWDGSCSDETIKNEEECMSKGKCTLIGLKQEECNKHDGFGWKDGKCHDDNATYYTCGAIVEKFEEDDEEEEDDKEKACRFHSDCINVEDLENTNLSTLQRDMLYEKLVTRAVEKEACQLGVDSGTGKINLEKNGYKGKRGQCANNYDFEGSTFHNECISDWDCGYFQLGQLKIGEEDDYCTLNPDDDITKVPCSNCRYGYSYATGQCCGEGDDCNYGVAPGDYCDPIRVYKEEGSKESPNWCGHCPYSFYRNNNASESSAYCCEKGDQCFEGVMPGKQCVEEECAKCPWSWVVKGSRDYCCQAHAGDCRRPQARWTVVGSLGSTSTEVSADRLGCTEQITHTASRMVPRAERERKSGISAGTAATGGTRRALREVRSPTAAGETPLTRGTRSATAFSPQISRERLPTKNTNRKKRITPVHSR